MTNRFLARDTMPAQVLRPVRDLAGIGVRDASGVGIGALWGALADAQTGLIRYLDIALERTPRHVLVPIGHARLREQDDDQEVRLRAALLEELTAIPTYEPAQHVDEQYETSLLDAHGQLFHGERYYAHPSFDHRGFYAGRNPITRTEGARADSGLQPLRELDGYRIVADEPDIRGWPLVGSASDSLGVVADVIVDVDAEEVRYLAIENERTVLVPIGFLELDAARERVIAPGMRADDLTLLPDYAGGPVERIVEEQVRHAIAEAFRGTRRYELPDYRR
jgi:hypothetical protein